MFASFNGCRRTVLLPPCNRDGVNVTADETAGTAGAPDVRSCDRDGVDVSVDVITDDKVVTITKGTYLTTEEAGDRLHHDQMSGRVRETELMSQETKQSEQWQHHTSGCATKTNWRTQQI